MQNGKPYLIDANNRDGVQTSRIVLPKLSKTMLNMHLDEMGICQSEVGFPPLKCEINYINTRSAHDISSDPHTRRWRRT